MPQYGKGDFIMNAKQAREALLPTLEDIARVLTDVGLCAKARVSFSDVDMLDHEDMMQNSALLYGEILFSANENESVALECAVSVKDGEVADEEFLSEISALRTEAKRIAEIAKTVGADALFDELERQSEDDEPRAEVREVNIDDYIADRAADELERDGDIAKELKRQGMIGHLPILIGIGAVIAVVILLIALL